MIIKGTRFGDIHYTEKDLFLLPDGLVGIPGKTRFLILDFEENSAFKWLQSADDAGIGYLISDPRLFRSDFDMRPLERESAKLEIGSSDDLVVFVLCTWRGSLEESTANFLGPVLAHAGKRVGKQVILDGSMRSTQEKLMPEPLPADSQKAADRVRNCG
ncbi:MAG: flagellar assembly protein FliW [Candidatus Krumholzibacteria bacterium]|jgi:flagellar assembly factor FliW|nr:flagellar assembly protein FliW [Candidatus Krumholzibacteria bacterium]MDP6797687.1 flagellar assembly protein FliW [Candidatus Krumholzibacteria bacterium]MDP7020972.1 flagellar assembly protein FliW [Candidatus Krumholzibacteria bacterium]